MKNKLIHSFYLLFIPCLLLAQKNNFITVKGKQLQDAAGKPFFMKGTNLGNWLVPEGYMFKFKTASSPRLIQEVINELTGPEESKKFWQQHLHNYVQQADIHYLRSVGMNSIRIPFHYKLFTDEDYLGGHGEKRGFALLDTVIHWCKQEGLYVILDMHCAPGGQTGDNIDDSWAFPFLFDNAASRQLTINTWKKIAAHYANEKTVMGYDLLNEPIAHYFDKAHFNPLLEPLYKEITAAIRTLDRNHLIFLGGAQWDSDFSPFGPPFDSKLVYTFHKYWTPATIDVIQTYIDFGNKYNVPIYCGETGENTDEWVAQFRKLLDEQKIGWHFWPYKKPDNTRGIVQFSIPAGYENISRFADSSRTSFEDTRKKRPAGPQEIKQALDGFNENCLFKNCRPNKGYIEALGFKP
jgi:endoglucanase